MSPPIADPPHTRHPCRKIVTTVSELIQPWLKLYVDQLKLEFHETGEFYLFHVGNNLARNMSSSQWCSVIKGIFEKWSPNRTNCPPKVCLC